MDYYKKLGENIRNIRNIRNLSLPDVSQIILERFDVDLSANLIGMWERGERRISAEYLDYLCKALECTPNLLYPGYDASPSERMMQEFAALPEAEKAILEFGHTEWDGNIHALIQFDGLYMALPTQIIHYQKPAMRCMMHCGFIFFILVSTYVLCSIYHK